MVAFRSACNVLNRAAVLELVESGFLGLKSESESKHSEKPEL